MVQMSGYMGTFSGENCVGMETDSVLSWRKISAERDVEGK